MSDPFVRAIGTVDDLDGTPVEVGVDYDSVTIRSSGLIRLESLQADEFAALYNRACWEAGAQSARMAAEAVPGDALAETADRARADIERDEAAL